MLRLAGATGAIAVFKMDLDNFKEVNNLLGHTVGDEAIRLYCSIIQKLIGSRGEVYRRGGDETVALAPGLESTRANALAEEIRANVESEFRVWGAERGLATCPTASVGLVLTNGTRPADDVIRRMDRAQLQAKQEGKNRVVCLE